MISWEDYNFKNYICHSLVIHYGVGSYFIYYHNREKKEYKRNTFVFINNEVNIVQHDGIYRYTAALARPASVVALPEVV